MSDNVVEEYTDSGCKVEIYWDNHYGHEDMLNDSEEIAVVTFSRDCWLVNKLMDVTARDDVVRRLVWSGEVPANPGPEPEEPDPDSYEDTPEGQAEYDSDYMLYEQDTDLYQAGLEKWEPYQEWEDQYIEGYRVFEVHGHVHSGVHLSLGDELTYSNWEEAQRAFGFVVVEKSAFAKEETEAEEFLRLAEGTKPEDHAFNAAKSMVEYIDHVQSGNVFGFTVTFPDGADDGCGGFVGDVDKSGIKDEIQSYIEHWKKALQRMHDSFSTEEKSNLVHAIMEMRANKIIEQGDEKMAHFLMSIPEKSEVTAWLKKVVS